MKLTEVDQPFNRKGWSFELKLDGFRALAFLTEGEPRLLSSNGNQVQANFPTIAAALAKISHQAIFDGELVCFNEEGLPDFSCMQSRFHTKSATAIAAMDRSMPATFCIFDLLYLDGYDLRNCQLADRRALLEELNVQGPGLRVVDVFPEEGELLFQHAQKLGFEGIVGKKLASVYLPGTRSTEWLKVKNSHTEDFIIGGFTEGEGSRGQYIGSLLLGKPENGIIRYVGTSGGGFSGQQLAEITAMMRSIETDKNPFTGPITATGKKHWVQPIHWAEVGFQAWTTGGRIRIPVFKRFRTDLSGPNAKGEYAVAAEADVAQVLQQLAGAGEEMMLEVCGHRFHLSHLNRELWPAHGITPPLTKRDLLIYLAKVSDFLIPHLKDRPLTFMRFPEGITGEREVERHWKPGLPDFVPRTHIWSNKSQKATEYILVNDLATLLWTAQIGAVEWHPWYSRAVPEKGLGNDWSSSESALLASAINHPDFIVFDLDPYIYSGKEGKGKEPELNEDALRACIEVAVATRDMLAGIGLESFLKWSGKTGFHLYVPIVRDVPYELTRDFAQQIGLALVGEMPKQVTMEWAVEKRKGRVFFDHKMNVRGKTLVSPFSPRAVPNARIARPLAWSDLDTFNPAAYTMLTVPGMLQTFKDPWADILRHAHDLKEVLAGKC
jgi:bifunctional non-homologous end joining protein LigD